MGKKRGIVISNKQLAGFKRTTEADGTRMWTRHPGEKFANKAQVLAYLNQTGGKSVPGGKLTDEELGKGVI